MGELLGIPVGQPNAPVAYGLINQIGFRRSMDAVSGLCKIDPNRSDRAVWTGRDLEGLAVFTLLEVLLWIVGVRWVQDDRLDLVVAGRRGIALRANCSRVT